MTKWLALLALDHEVLGLISPEGIFPLITVWLFIALSPFCQRNMTPFGVLDEGVR